MNARIQNFPRKVIGKFDLIRLLNDYRVRIYRRNFEEALIAIMQNGDHSFDGKVLIDATFDNPNFWMRYSIFGAALGLRHADCIGIIGPVSRERQRKTLRRFGIGEIFDLADHRHCYETNWEKAVELCGHLSDGNEILNWKLPNNVPAALLYDYILKRQRNAYVNLDDDKILSHVCDYLCLIDVSEKLVKESNPKLVIASHAQGRAGPLVWISILLDIMVVVPYGENGVSWYWALKEPNDIFDLQDRMIPEEIETLPEKQKWLLKENGEKAVNRRLNGRSIGLGPKEAYLKRDEFIDRQGICNHFSWDEHRPIICVYASNWFDYPHTYGMTNFANFFEWIKFTLDHARDNAKCSWLFKAHPCDDWYGGLTLDDFFDFLKYPHIKLAPDGWNGKALLDCIDGVITYHGTIGVEASCMGKPVLVADKGWYSEIGFVRRPNNRDEFGRLLFEEWWMDVDTEKNANLAHVFAGTYWGRPAWQEKLVFDDDSDQWSIYKTARNLLRTNKNELRKEIDMIGNWISSGHKHFHTYKMLKSDSYLF